MVERSRAISELALRSAMTMMVYDRPEEIGKMVELRALNQG